MKIPSIKLADPIDLPTVVVDVVVTLEDQVRFSEHMRDRPEIRRRRRLFLAIMLLAGPPIGMLAGFLAGSDDPTLSQIVRDGGPPGGGSRRPWSHCWSRASSHVWPSFSGGHAVRC